ncbi:hypothetical protein [uncultured Cohaesibacter sp.]|nr:hypothetical protein [uncultured Cohaesibacter sp.]
MAIAAIGVTTNGADILRLSSSTRGIVDLAAAGNVSNPPEPAAYA